MINLSKSDYALAENTAELMFIMLPEKVKAVFMRIGRSNCQFRVMLDGWVPVGKTDNDTGFSSHTVYRLDPELVKCDDPISKYEVDALANAMNYRWESMAECLRSKLVELGKENCQVKCENDWVSCKGGTFYGDMIYRLRPDYPVAPPTVTLCVDPTTLVALKNGNVVLIGELKKGDVLMSTCSVKGCTVL